MQTKNIATRYSQEVKESIVSIKQIGRFTNSLLKGYDFRVSIISKWIRQADSADRTVLSLRERELVKENKRLKEEMDILKRAAVLLAKNGSIKGEPLYEEWFVLI